jgi:hypothetical protein
MDMMRKMSEEYRVSFPEWLKDETRKEEFARAFVNLRGLLMGIPKDVRPFEGEVVHQVNFHGSDQAEARQQALSIIRSGFDLNKSVNYSLGKGVYAAEAGWYREDLAEQDHVALALDVAGRQLSPEATEKLEHELLNSPAYGVKRVFGDFMAGIPKDKHNVLSWPDELQRYVIDLVCFIDHVDILTFRHGKTFVIKHPQRAIKKITLGPGSAMNVKNGGIDLSKVKVDSRGNDSAGIQFHIDPAQSAELQNAPGFTPVVIDIRPLADVAAFLGVKKSSI